MLQGNAIENGTMFLRLRTVLGIAKGFTHGLRRGNKCRLELPEKWRNEFSGFLINAVFKIGYSIDTLGVTMDSQDEVVWVGYISFASLKKKNIPWWDQTYNHLSFSIGSFGPIYGFGVRLVGKKGESESGSKDSSQLSNYIPDFSIDHVSPSSVQCRLLTSVQIDIPTLVFDD